jgi:hypothetical protein
MSRVVRKRGAGLHKPSSLTTAPAPAPSTDAAAPAVAPSRKWTHAGCGRGTFGARRGLGDALTLGSPFRVSQSVLRAESGPTALFTVPFTQCALPWCAEVGVIRLAPHDSDAAAPARAPAPAPHPDAAPAPAVSAPPPAQRTRVGAAFDAGRAGDGAATSDIEGEDDEDVEVSTKGKTATLAATSSASAAAAVVSAAAAGKVAKTKTKTKTKTAKVSAAPAAGAGDGGASSDGGDDSSDNNSFKLWPTVVATVSLPANQAAAKQYSDNFSLHPSATTTLATSLSLALNCKVEKARA